jgi:hypothetical protein
MAVGFRVESPHPGQGLGQTRGSYLPFPDPFLGSCPLHRSLPIRCRALGPTCRMSRVSLPALQHITGGDNNPDCLLGVFAPASRVALSLAAGPAVPAIACFARHFSSEDRTPYQEPFPFSPVTSVPDDPRNIQRRPHLPEENQNHRGAVIHRGTQDDSIHELARCINRWKS